MIRVGIGYIKCKPSSLCPPNSAPTPPANPAYCTCVDGYEPDAAGTACVPDNYVITLGLNPGDSVEPSRTAAGDGKSHKTINAIVRDKTTNQPKDGIPVEISVKVKSGTGGHDHDGNRPRGSLNGKECKSDATCFSDTTHDGGLVIFSFDAPEVSGTHTITAKCSKCKAPDEKPIDVKVDGLQEIPETMAWTRLNKPGAKHKKGHYLSAPALRQLSILAGNYNLNFPSNSVLHLNDSSLIWGGLFDVNGNWQTGYHSKHRLGKVIDIRANDTAPGAIPLEDFDKFKNMAIQKGIDPQTPHCSPGRSFAVDQCVGDEGRHFHVLLLNEEG